MPITSIIIIALLLIAAFVSYLLAFRIKWRELLSVLLAPLAGMVPSFITPNHITVLSFVIMLAAAVFIYLAGSAPVYLLWAIACMVLSAVADTLDGFLARSRGSSSLRGMFLDYTLDKLGYLSLLFAAMLGGLIRPELVVATMSLSLFYNIIDLESTLLLKDTARLTEHSRWVVPAIILCLIGLWPRTLGYGEVYVLGMEFTVLDAAFLIFPTCILALALYRTIYLWKNLKAH